MRRFMRTVRGRRYWLPRQTGRGSDVLNVQPTRGCRAGCGCVILAAFAQGLFEPTGYAGASIVIWAAVIAGLVGRALPAGRVGRLAAAGGLFFAATTVLAAASV